MPSSEPSAFSHDRLEAAGLADIAERAHGGAALSFEQARRLLETPFPLLTALAELGPRQSVPSRLRPLLFIPLNALLAQGKGSEAVYSSVDAELERVFEQLPAGRISLALAIDDWAANRLYRRIVPVLQKLAQTARQPLSILGPSTAELKTVAQVETGEVALEFFSSDFFAELHAAGIDTLEGGTDIRLHRIAAQNGMHVTYTHNLVRSRLLPPGDQFLRDIFELRAELLPTGGLETWSPWSSFVLDSGLPKGDSPLGLEILRAVVLARLLLPEVPFIRAPLSLLGIHASEVAAALGANDFGFGAVQIDTAERLGLFPLSLILEEFQAPHQLSGSFQPIIQRRPQSTAS